MSFGRYGNDQRVTLGFILLLHVGRKNISVGNRHKKAGDYSRIFLGDRSLVRAVPPHHDGICFETRVFACQVLASGKFPVPKLQEIDCAHDGTVSHST